MGFKKLRDLSTQFLLDERGQSTTEYILILSVVVMVALKFKQTFAKQLDTLLSKTEGNMNNFVDQQ